MQHKQQETLLLNKLAKAKAAISSGAEKTKEAVSNGTEAAKEKISEARTSES